ncbi:MAG: hypothetical protein ACI9EF_001408 [Pseudohongiellaceae bacterium]|jgi:hypothetical protein
MLDRILKYIESPARPDDAFVRLDSARFNKNDVLFELSVLDYNCEDVWASWKVHARGVRECSIGREGGDLVLLQPDHVLVKQHTQPREQLYFHGTAASAPEVLGLLWQAHRGTAGAWIAFERYLNSSLKLDELLPGAYGLLADGPIFLTKAYAAVLDSAGMNPNTLGPKRAVWWDGTRWVENPPELVGFSLGDTFVVACALDEEEVLQNAG